MDDKGQVELKRLAVDLPVDVIVTLKKLRVKTGISIRFLVYRALTEFLEKQEV